MTAQGGSASLKTMLIWRQRRSYFSNAFRRTRSALQCPTKVLEAVETLFDNVDTGGVTEPNSAIVTEGSSRNDRHVSFAQQSIGESLRGQTKLTDIHKHVKCALWFNRGNVGNLRNAIKHVIATHIKLFAHVDHRLLIAL